MVDINKIKDNQFFSTLFFVIGGIASITIIVNAYYEIKLNRLRLKKENNDEQ